MEIIPFCHNTLCRSDGVEEGIELGEVDGTDVGMCEGTEDGYILGTHVGTLEGVNEGIELGDELGEVEGIMDGTLDALDGILIDRCNRLKGRRW